MRFTTFVLCLALLGSLPGFAKSPVIRLPAQVAAPGSVERIPAPAGSLVMFYLFQPGRQARFGVARADGGVVWQRQVGFRPVTDYFWGERGRAVVFVTDCVQPEAELRSAIPETRSYFFALDARDGRVLAEGDLDTAVLDLPRRLPAAVGCAHVIERLELNDGVMSVTINHLGTQVAGRAVVVR